MKIIGISGWLQSPEALHDVLPGITPFRYDHFADDRRQFLQQLAAQKPEAVIGWSLGSVLAVQGLLHPEYRPRKLVLIAAPWQFLKSPEVPEGMPPEDYENFRREYIVSPKATARRLQLLSNHGMPKDTPLCPLAENVEDTEKWLPWLEHLAATNFGPSKYAHRPEVLLIHGGRDAICAPGQSKYWARLFPEAQVLMLPRAAHAPHRQDAATLKRTVEEFLHDIKADTQAAAG